MDSGNNQATELNCNDRRGRRLADHNDINLPTHSGRQMAGYPDQICGDIAKVTSRPFF